ncbi:MFS transporter [Commensalibacter oyaizuii]|uniref:MFS transporter n=1 Tax=Commensalibacter oyaizuii TaxID=3043873 RepID=A0ABT6Q381_9PROT|nr:MFS transporter [Commensalibacter sp. TBRC 16381]MDI2091458.1 MFS transporter [Commensalibacter sp. TBRC 16381]
MAKTMIYIDPVLNIAVKKTWYRLVPLMFLLYFIAFIDRINISFAQEAMKTDIGLSNSAYGLGAGIFFAAYALCGVPANLALNKMGAQRWLGITTIIWGGLSVATAFIQNETQFIIIRFLLGVGEAGFLPGILLLAAIYFPNKVRGSVIGAFALGVPLALSIGSPLSGALLQMHGLLGYSGWSWMFIIEGAVAVLVGGFTWYYLDDNPSKARFLTQNEKDAIQRRLQQEEQNTQTVSVISALKNTKVWYLGTIYGLIQISVYGLMFFLPSQVATLMGQNIGLKQSLVSAIPWVCSGVGVYYIPRIADRFPHYRITLSALCMVLAAFGLALSTASNLVVVIIALSCSAIGFLSVQPIFWTFPAQFLSGPALAVGIGFCTTMGAVGSFIAPNIRVQVDQFMHNSYAGLYVLSLITLFCAFLIMMLSYTYSHPPIKHTQII